MIKTDNYKLKWVDEGGIFFPVNGNTVLHSSLGPGVWKVVPSPRMNDGRLGLTKVCDKFEFEYKIYDIGNKDFRDKVINVWNSDLFIEDGRNLGIIMNGTKGTGKTVSAKLLCNELGMPVVIIDSDFDGRILEFIQNLDYECVVLIDEAEKTFKDERDNSEILLKLIDGIYNRSRKLYILTTNRLTVNENLLGRPGRIRYIQEFNNLDPKLISLYLDDNLKDKEKKQYVTEIVDLLEISTIDILKNVVDEVNLFGEIPEDSPMNIPRGKYVFDILKLYGCTEDDIPQVKEFLDKHKNTGKSLYDWLYGKADNEDLPESCKEGEDDCYYNYELLRNDYGCIKNCTYSVIDKLSTKYSMMWKDCDTSIGRVLTEPDTFIKEGGDYNFVLIEGKYDKEVYLCVILKQRKSPTLYHGVY